MFNEYDVIWASKNISDKVLKGTKGAILMVFNCTRPQYEVEFIDEEGDTIDIITVSEDDISDSIN